MAESNWNIRDFTPEGYCPPMTFRHNPQHRAQYHDAGGDFVEAAASRAQAVQIAVMQGECGPGGRSC
ncbi:hypothetical protein [Blastochloris tepida]|uniref:hypothetical protein n=1 Tax=Blastochloris tepida TaxID=2233851 RepID=UPI000F8323E7|nr:hypothetical protein [Blastochloris tepida]